MNAGNYNAHADEKQDLFTIMASSPAWYGCQATKLEYLLSSGCLIVTEISIIVLHLEYEFHLN